jgi:hypothetical protein
MTTTHKQLTEEAFANHWQQQLQLGEDPPIAQLRLAERLHELGYRIPGDETAQTSARPALAVEPDKSEDVPKSIRLYEYPWTVCDQNFRETVTAQLNLVDDKYQVSQSTQIETCPLDWYENYQLLRLTDAAWNNDRLRLYYLIGPTADLFRLIGTSPAIHEVNAKAPIKLTRQNVLSYVVFFCYFVHGEEGPFYVLESMDDPILDSFRSLTVDPLLLETAFAVIEGTAKRATLTEVTADGNYECQAVVFYSNALFEVRFVVYPTGMVEMLEDDPIAADMPFRLQAVIR